MFLSTSALTPLIQQGVQTLAFVIVVFFCLARLSDGAGALLGVLGGLAGAAVDGVLTVGWAQVQYGHGLGVFTYLSRHTAASEALNWVGTAAVVLVALALVLTLAARRRPTLR